MYYIRRVGIYRCARAPRALYIILCRIIIIKWRIREQYRRRVKVPRFSMGKRITVSLRLHSYIIADDDALVRTRARAHTRLTVPTSVYLCNPRVNLSENSATRGPYCAV